MRQPAILLALGLTLAAPARAVEISGRVTTGVEIEQPKNGKSETAAKLKAKTKREGKTRASVEVEATTADREVILRGAEIDHKFGGGHSLELGLLKKEFGLEYELSDADRLPIKRTLLYKKLETFTYVGRESIVRWRHEGEALDTAVSVGYADSLDAHVLAALGAEFADDWHWHAWVLLQSDKVNRGRQEVGAVAGALAYLGPEARVEAELFGGVDPLETEFQRALGDKKTRYFAGGRGLYGRVFGSREDGLEPYFGLAGVRHDVTLPRHYSDQLLLGMNWYVSRVLQISLNASLIETVSRIDPDLKTYNDSSAGVEAKYVF